MEIQLPADQQLLIDSLVSSGRFSSASEVILAGVELLASTERLRQEVQVGIEQADRGEMVDHDTVFGHLKAIAATSSVSEDEPGCDCGLTNQRNVTIPVQKL